MAAAANSFASTPHEAFALAFCPGERGFHLFPLTVAQAHFGERGLHIDLLSDLRRSRRGSDRQGLMVEGVGVVIKSALWRPFLGPGLQRREFFVCRQFVA